MIISYSLIDPFLACMHGGYVNPNVKTVFRDLIIWSLHFYCNHTVVVK